MRDKVCINCRHGAIGISPSVGGFTSGVYCHSKDCAEYQDSLAGDDEYAKEYEMAGYMHLFRLECVTDGIDCPCFADRVGVDKAHDREQIRRKLGWSIHK